MSSTREDSMDREASKNRVATPAVDWKVVCYQENYYKLISTEVKSHFGIQRITNNHWQDWTIILMVLALGIWFGLWILFVAVYWVVN